MASRLESLIGEAYIFSGYFLIPGIPDKTYFKGYLSSPLTEISVMDKLMGKIQLTGLTVDLHDGLAYLEGSMQDAELGLAKWRIGRGRAGLPPIGCHLTKRRRGMWAGHYYSLDDEEHHIEGDITEVELKQMDSSGRHFFLKPPPDSVLIEPQNPRWRPTFKIFPPELTDLLGYHFLP